MAIYHQDLRHGGSCQKSEKCRGVMQ